MAAIDAGEPCIRSPADVLRRDGAATFLHRKARGATPTLASKTDPAEGVVADAWSGDVLALGRRLQARASTPTDGVEAQLASRHARRLISDVVNPMLMPKAHKPTPTTTPEVQLLMRLLAHRWRGDIRAGHIGLLGDASTSSPTAARQAEQLQRLFAEVARGDQLGSVSQVQARAAAPTEASEVQLLRFPANAACRDVLAGHVCCHVRSEAGAATPTPRLYTEQLAG